MTVFRKIFFFSTLLVLSLMIDIEWGYAGSKTLMINPVRVVFEGRQRTAKVKVANTNPEPVRYRISLVTMRKNESGSLVLAESDNERDKLIKSMIRFSPRQATINPGTRQVVKLMVRKPSDLPEGEYKTRLRFMPLADPVNSSSPQDGEGDSGSQFNVDLIVGVTIPVVIQHGKVNAIVTPTNIALTKYPHIPSGLAAVITVSRSGNFSAFGDVVVSHIGGSARDKQIIGQGKDIGIYIPDTQRTFGIPMKNLEKVDLSSGKFRVEFHRKSQDKRTPVISYKDFPIAP